MTKLNIAIAQINPILGDISYNSEKIYQYWLQAKEKGVDILITPECALTGYPLEDLTSDPNFMSKVLNEIQNLKSRVMDGPSLILGTPYLEDISELILENIKPYNSALVIEDGEIQHIRHKHELPNYDVFDEKRNFRQGDILPPIIYKNHVIGIMICEDMWHDNISTFWKRMCPKIDYVFVLNGSPYEHDKTKKRIFFAKALYDKLECEIYYANLVGGQDEIVFDGTSFLMDPTWVLEGVIGSSFKEELLVFKGVETGPLDSLLLPDMGNDYNAVVLGLRDYVNKNNFKGVIIGNSGGIDSALTINIAADALGSDRVKTYMMPYKWTSSESIELAEDLANTLGVSHKVIDITQAVDAEINLLKEADEEPSGVALENIQSRVRGLTLMAISNQTGYLVITTGNKSEVSVGYCTLYGDMTGSFNPLKDMYKTKVYEISRLINHGELFDKIGFLERNYIPNRIIDREPTAELAPDQKDSNSLPKYHILDPILKFLLDTNMTYENIQSNTGVSMDMIYKIQNMLNSAEFKRRQACIGVKLDSNHFGKGRRVPITNRFKV